MENSFAPAGGRSACAADRNGGLTPEEKWERATLANNFIFYKVMSDNPDVCKRVLEILLEMEIDRIELRSESEISVDFQSKGVRLDVYAKNAGQAFDLEMQVADTRELPERARYYQGIIDVDTLKSGQKYSELKDSYIIFICMQDIFKKGRAVYTFQNLCVQAPDILLGDRCKKLFYIAENCAILSNAEQRAFLSLLADNKGSDAFTKRISRLAQDAKKNVQYKRQFMEWERQRTYDFEAGMEKGIQQKAVDAARSFAANGVSADIIAKSLGMTVQEVEQIIADAVLQNA